MELPSFPAWVATAARLAGFSKSSQSVNMAVQLPTVFNVHLHPDSCSLAGDYHYRSGPDAEKHMNDPEAIAKLQAATAGNSRELWRQFSLLNTQLSRQVGRTLDRRGWGSEYRLGVQGPLQLREGMEYSLWGLPRPWVGGMRTVIMQRAAIAPRLATFIWPMHESA